MKKSPEAVRPRRAGRRPRRSATPWSATTSASATGARATSTRSRSARRGVRLRRDRASSRSPGAARSARRAGSAHAIVAGDVALGARPARPAVRGRGPGGRGRPARPRARLPDREPPPARRARCGRQAGIYAVRAGWPRARDGASWQDAVASLGVRPTFGGGDLRLEVHLFDREIDLYGRRLCCGFIERLRAEETLRERRGRSRRRWTGTAPPRARRSRRRRGLTARQPQGGDRSDRVSFLTHHAADSYSSAHARAAPTRRITVPVPAEGRDRAVVASTLGSLLVTASAEPSSSAALRRHERHARSRRAAAPRAVASTRQSDGESRL